MKQAAGTYAFREITTEQELLQAFRLRYDTYQSAPHLQELLAPNAQRLDIDGFDVYSRHYGLFKISKTGDAMIGYLRVVYRQEMAWVKRLIEKLSAGNGLQTGPRPAPFRCMKDFPNASQLLGMPMTESTHFISEPGRFIIMPEYRSVGLAQFVIESIMTIGFADPFMQFALIDCQAPHRRMYERNGFCWLGAQEKQARPWQLMLLTRAAVEKQLPDLQERICQYLEQGALCIRLGQVDWKAYRYLPVVAKRYFSRVFPTVDKEVIV